MRPLLAILFVGILCPGCQRPAAPQRATFSRAIPWAESGVWLKADTHVHTKFSDGGVPLEEVARRAYANGCDLLAITDHADSELTATSDEYFDELAAAREQFPEMVVLAGLEWNVPPWQGREHASVLVPPTSRERETLRHFQLHFDDWKRDGRDPELALAALRWLSTQSQGAGELPVVFYNHPSRKRDGTKEWVVEMSQWRATGPVAVGFEGGPGHQDSQPIGAYQELATIDRWDPAVAETGGAWDQMLQGGVPVWGALATSDFHNGNPQAADDFWPGEFSETWLFAADRTPAAALAALRAGSFFGVHGQIAREVQLTVLADGLSRPAIAGESIRVPPGSIVSVGLEFHVPLLDWQGKANLIDEVELIAITPHKVEPLSRQKPALIGKAVQIALPIPQGPLTLRARGRRVIDDGPDLMFYTNPIQIHVDQPLAVVATHGASGAGGAIIKSGVRAPGLSATDSPNREMPAWIYVALIVGCSVFLTLLDRWRIEIGRRFSRDIQLAKPQLISRPHVLQRHLLVALACCVLLGVYGSLVPFTWKQQTWPRALAEFAVVLQQPLSFSSKSDWATNVLLFLPLGFLATGVAMGRLTSDFRRSLVPPLVVAGCVALSFAIEFAQLWLADRYCSQNDIVAESLGGLLGASAWLVGGNAVAAWLNTFATYHRPRQRVERMLEVYLLAVFALALLPLDLTLRPAEIHDKWQAGKVNLLPLADLSWTWQAIIPVIEDVLLLLPVGVLAALWRWPGENTVRPLSRSLLMGTVLLCLIETAQLLVVSRYSSTTDLFTGLLGMATGWALARKRIASLPPQSPEVQSRAARGALALAAGFALLLMLVLALPFDRIASAAEAAERWQAMWARPLLAVLQAGAIENAVAQALRKTLLFSTFGALAAMATWPFPSRSPAWWRAACAALALIVAVSIGAELVQLWLVPRVPDLSDVFLTLLGGGVGMAGILALAALRSGSQQTQTTK